MGKVRLPPMDVDYSSEIKNYPTWVVESEGNILGGLIMVYEHNQASIANIAVDPKFQGQGIGGDLMDFAESRAKKMTFLNCDSPPMFYLKRIYPYIDILDGKKRAEMRSEFL